MTKVARLLAGVVAFVLTLTLLVPAWADESGQGAALAAETDDGAQRELVTDTALSPMELAFDEDHAIEIAWGWDYFAEDPTVYNHTLAMTSTVLAQATKISQATTEARVADLGFGHIQSAFYGNLFAVDNPATTFGSRLVELNGEPRVVIAVVIRGTDNFGDILTDIGAVFNRFSLAAGNVQDRFVAYYEGLDDYYGFDVNADNTVLYLAGHSLGGAVAGQLAVTLEGTYAVSDAIYAYTFGSPRYATADDPEAYANVHTVINTDDVFPALALAGGWNGQQYYFDSTDERYQQNLDWIYNTPQWTPPGFVEPHNPPTYLAMMLAAEPSTDRPAAS